MSVDSVLRRLAIALTATNGACLPALEVREPLPSLIGVYAREQAFQVGHPAVEGDSVLTGETWPDERLGWRVGDPFRMPLSDVARVVSLEDVAVATEADRDKVWAVLSTAHAEDPLRWDAVYLFSMDEPVPEACERIAILQLGRWSIGTRYRWSLEQLRTTAGSLGANALHLSRWSDPATDESVISPLFGPDWRYSVALAVWCPMLPERPGSAGGGAGTR